jgi:hypothetical protein
VVSFLLNRQPWPLEDESAAALVRALSAERAGDDGSPTPERTAASKIEEALQRSERPPIRPTVGEARAILDAVEHGIDADKSDELLDLYETLHRWVERASRQM